MASSFLVGGIAPILLAGVLIFAIPEKILILALKQNRSDRVARQSLRGSLRLLPSLPARNLFLREEQRGGLPVKNLFTEGRALMTSLLWLAFAMSLVGHYFLTSWLPTVLEGSGVSMAHAVLAGALFQFGGGCGNLVVTWFLDKKGIIAIVAAFALAVPLTVMMGFSSSSDTLLMVIVFLAGLCMLGGQVGLNALSGTIYPTYIRSTGAGWAFGVGRLGSIIGPAIGGILINVLPTSSLFILCRNTRCVVLRHAATYFLGRAPVAAGTQAPASFPRLSVFYIKPERVSAICVGNNSSIASLLWQTPCS